MSVGVGPGWSEFVETVVIFSSIKIVEIDAFADHVSLG
jgi:hypothetical protein